MSANRTVVPILLILTLACGEEVVDPMDRATIERDLEERSVRDLLDEAEQRPWSIPDNHRLTEAHIADFVKVAALAERIMEVTGSRFEDQMEQATRAENRFSRMGSAFTAMGNARQYSTAHVRAALTLDVNPHQQQWVVEQVIHAGRIAVRKRPYDEAVARARREHDEETNAYLRIQKGSAVREAEERLKDFEQTLGDTELANARLVEKNASALSRFFPFLKRK
jgi:hypothetical protein